MEPTAGAVIDIGSIRNLPGVNLRQDIICVQLKNIRLCNFYNPSFIKGGRWPFLPLTFSCRRSERSLGDFSKYCRNFYNWLPIAFLRLPIFFICQPASTDMQQQATIEVLLIYRKKVIALAPLTWNMTQTSDYATDRIYFMSYIPISWMRFYRSKIASDLVTWIYIKQGFWLRTQFYFYGTKLF